MLFSTPIFIFLFLPLVLLLYYAMPHRGRNVFLLFASVIFYSWGEQELVLIMLTSVICDYFSAIIIETRSRRLGLTISLIVNLSLLGYFKYANFTFETFQMLLETIGMGQSHLINLPNIALPLGISFYTFQTLSYTIDVYRGEIKATRNFIDFATYVTLFPQLIAGPIVRYSDIQYQLKRRPGNSAQFIQGIERFIIGLAKKMILANTFALVADAAFSQPAGDLSIGLAWLGLTAYSFQLFFDFSGYTDMAIGLGKMFGFNFPENFNYPYVATSVREFWRRWHITLTTWFRDYVYFSLGGNRRKPMRVYLNLLVVFLLTGLWHGASWNFILFGIFHGLFMIMERLLGKLARPQWIRPLRHVYLLWVVQMSWVLFRADSLSHSWDYYKVLYGINSLGIDGVHPFINREILLVTMSALVLSLPTYHLLKKKAQHVNIKHPSIKNIMELTYKLFLIFLFLLSISYIAADTYNPFIYFRF
ncbi:MAG: MBOAT family protein [Saprospiraceae bacterium]|nr:MBOAT family protein [Saprospiraceae bacterium]